MNKFPSLLQQLMAKFSYSQKINAIFGTVLMTTIVISTLFIYGQFSLLQKTESERLGMRYQTQLRNIIELLTKQRLLHMQNRSGSNENRHALDYLQLQLPQAFHEFITLDDEIGEPLATRHDDLNLRENITLLPLSLYHQWQALSDALINLEPDASDRFHEELLGRINRLLLYIGDTSQLTFDDEIEPHYLLNVMLDQLPAAQMLMGQMVKIAERATDEKSFQNQLLPFVTLLSDNVDQSRVQLNKVFIKESNIDHEQSTEKALAADLENYLTSVGTFLNATHQLIESEEALNSFRSHGLQASNSNFNLWRSIDEEIINLLDERMTQIKVRSYIILTVIAIILLLSSFACIAVLKETDRFLTELFDALYRFSQGNLNACVSNVVYDSELERLRLMLNELGRRLETLITQLQTSSVELTSSTTQIAAAAKQQEGSIFQQEATAKEILVATEEISSTAKRCGTTIDTVSRAAEETALLATTGRQELEQIQTSINQMLSASASIAIKLGSLNDQSTAMTSSIATITTIADRTHLLSLNIAIEAEKAGPNGKNFGVIAREIQRLADQVANATLEIEKMSDEMSASISEGVSGASRFNEELHRGTQQVGEISERFSKIITEVQQVTSSFEEVIQGIEDQSLEAEQINSSILRLSDSTEQTTHSIKQFHSAIDQLTLLTQMMQGSLSSMKK